MKIAVLGYSGSGKSTLAKYLSDFYQIPVLYLDTVNFEAGWKERNREEAAAMVAEFMKNDSWVIDGNYTAFLQEERLEQADLIVFLWFSRLNCLRRAFQRYVQYKDSTRESMAAGCREKFDFAFVWWILYKGRRKQARRRNRNLLRNYAEKSVLLKNQRELDRFMAAPFRNA